MSPTVCHEQFASQAWFNLLAVGHNPVPLGGPSQGADAMCRFACTTCDNNTQGAASPSTDASRVPRDIPNNKSNRPAWPDRFCMRRWDNKASPT
eukprot:CAMPEP_0183402454 /NCGR_PEP_ID=MMETSP0370-20130417/13915_1 /TAXON_ID=268820 /ORGANISM="Peridinium aciculiferum, Strain PAER-2" /LENGTH=93 /DNA_ID=CAMNT_0025584045 /DNA_START=566 /DNA_END=843 /DNA_ORIENTATION=+